MSEKKTKFKIESSKRNPYLMAYLSFGAMFVGIALSFTLPSEMATGAVVLIMFCAIGYGSYRMLVPTRYTLRIDEGIASLSRNGKPMAEVNASELEIELIKMPRWDIQVFNPKYVLKVVVKFPNRQKVKFVVNDKNAIFLDSRSSSFLSMEEQGVFASGMQVQNLLDYYEFDSVVRLESF